MVFKNNPLPTKKREHLFNFRAFSKENYPREICYKCGLRHYTRVKEEGKGFICIDCEEKWKIK